MIKKTWLFQVKQLVYQENMSARKLFRYDFEMIERAMRKTTVPRLRKFMKLVGVKGTSRYRKMELVSVGVSFLAVRVIQRFIRKRLALNDNCYISLEPVRYPCYPLRVSETCSKFNYYNLEPLINYFSESGEFREPVTRRPLFKTELSKIDLFVRKVKLKTDICLIEAQANLEFYRKKRVFEQTIETIANEARDIACGLRDILETSPHHFASEGDPEFIYEFRYKPALAEFFGTLRSMCKDSFERVRKSVLRIVKSSDEDEFYRGLKLRIMDDVEKSPCRSGSPNSSDVARLIVGGILDFE